MFSVEALAEVIRTEISNQESNVDYDAMSEAELESLIEKLENKAVACKAAMAKKAADGAEAPKKKEAPKMVAKKAEGEWPDLPWGGACRAVHRFCLLPAPIC